MAIGLLWLPKVHGWRVLGLHWEYVGGCCAGARVGEGHLSIGRQWAPPWYLCIEHVEQWSCSRSQGCVLPREGRELKWEVPPRWRDLWAMFVVSQPRAGNDEQSRARGPLMGVEPAP